MTPLLDSALRISALLVVGLAATMLMRNQSAAARHWVLGVAMACAAAMPMLALIVPSWQLPASSALAQEQAGVAGVIALAQLEPPLGARVDADGPRRAAATDYALAGRRVVLLLVGGAMLLRRVGPRAADAFHAAAQEAQRRRAA